METGWRKRLKGLIDETPGLNMKALSRKAGLSDSYVHDVMVRGFKPTIENFVAIADAAGVSAAWLLQGDQESTIKIPLVGVGTGEKWAAVQGKAPTIEFDLKGFDLIQLEVRGNELAPIYRDQDILIGQRHAGRFLQNLVGTDCIICTTKGVGYVKILRKGSRPGVFNLRSFNSAAEDLENVAIEWAAPITWIKRGGR